MRGVAGRPLVERRPGDGRGHTNGRPPGGLRRASGARRVSHRPYLRALRRAARGPRGPVDDTGVRARRARRPRVCSGLGGRQGTGPHARKGAGGETERSAAGLPVNVKLVIEGEEEIGSEHLERFLHNHRKRLSCDAVMISDTTMLEPDLPAITAGLRGLAYMEISVRGPNRDLHFRQLRWRGSEPGERPRHDHRWTGGRVRSRGRSGLLRSRGGDDGERNGLRCGRSRSMSPPSAAIWG